MTQETRPNDNSNYYELLNNMSQQEKLLRILNHYNLDGPFVENKNNDTDMMLARAFTRICGLYKSKFNNNYTFIIEYNNDIYSLLSYIIILNCGGILKKKLDIRLIGKLNSKEEKDFFAGVKTTTRRIAKKMKKTVYITGFHPICNVINLTQNYKDFIEIINPIEKFTPSGLDILESYYIKEELRKTVHKNENDKINYWKEFYTYPLSPNKIIDDTIDFYISFPISVFKLKNRENFEYFDFILCSAMGNNIHLYDLSECTDEDIEYFKLNLNTYLGYSQFINEFTILNDGEFESPNEVFTFTDETWRELVSD